jgi:amino acid adenylation domain-containing protein
VLSELTAAASGDTVGSVLGVSAAERTRLLTSWNGVETELPDQTLPQLFKVRARQSPTAVAIESDTGALTYAELDERADRLAGRLVAAGTVDRVGVLMDRSADLIVALLAVARAGGAYVPLDRRYPLERMRTILDQVGASVLLVDEAASEHEITRELTTVRADTDDPADGSPPDVPSDVDSLAYVMHTSGSTGEPKGVEVTHRNVAALALDGAFSGPAHRRVLFHSPHAFDASTYEIWVPLLSGGTVVVASGEVDALSLRRLIGEGRVTALWLTAGLFAALADGDPGCLRGIGEVWAGGEALSPHAVRRVLDACPGTAVVNGYGPTETTTFATCHPVTSSAQTTGAVPIGRPMDNVRAYVLDERLQLVPPGAVGQLHVGGSGVARGYAGRDDLTTERFLPDPFTPGGRMYATGDQVRWRGDGTLAYLGRTDTQVKIHGFRVEPGEIETRLAQHPLVSRAVVHPQTDGTGTRLVAYLVAAAGTAPSPDELRAFLAQRLPSYLVPSDLVVLERLPLTGNGKVDKDMLSAAAAASTPRTPPAAGTEFVRTLFAELLDEDDVTADDDFFELGGHSLLAARVVGRLQSELGVTAAVRDVFDAPTASALAARLGLDDALDGTVAPEQAMDAPRYDEDAASSVQERIWIAEKLATEPGSYNVPLAWRVTGDLDGQRLEAALARVIERHEALRTRFALVDGQLRQTVGAPWRPVVETHRATSTDALSEVMRTEFDRPFDLVTGPLLRAGLVDGPDGQLLLLNVHHIVFDEGSLPILLDELAAYYADQHHQAPLPRQYREFVATSGSSTEDGVHRCVRRLRGAPAHLPIPGPASPERHGVVPVPLPGDALARVRAVQKRRGMSWFMVGTAAVAATLHQWTGLDDVTFGFPTMNRDGGGLADVIGPCLNTVVVRSRCGTTTTAGDLLDAIRGQMLDALADHDVAFDKVVEALNPVRHYGATPYLDVVLAPQMTKARPPTLDGAELVPVGVTANSASIGKFALTITFSVVDDELRATVDYRGDRVDATTARGVAEMLGGALNLLTDADAADRPVRTRPAEKAGAALTVADAERRVAALWCSVLRKDEVGLHDRFFDIGGNSLLLITLHAKLCAELGVELPLQRLFEHTTVASLARSLSAPVDRVTTSVTDRAARARQGRAGARSTR